MALGQSMIEVGNPLTSSAQIYIQDDRLVIADQQFDDFCLGGDGHTVFVVENLISYLLISHSGAPVNIALSMADVWQAEEYVSGTLDADSNLITDYFGVPIRSREREVFEPVYFWSRDTTRLSFRLNARDISESGVAYLLPLDMAHHAEYIRIKTITPRQARECL